MTNKATKILELEPSRMVSAGLILIVSIALVFQTSNLSAKDFVMKRPPAISDPQVYGDNSRDADPKNWQATYVYEGENGKLCTATAVGEQVILTAAHCIKDQAVGTLESGSDRSDVVCRTHPAYSLETNRNKYADFSLCKVKKTIKAPQDGFERVNSILSVTPSRQSNIKLLGVGCGDNGQGRAGHTSGKLREGDAIILQVFPEYLMTWDGAAICMGDSGGGAYVSLGSSGLKRRLVAVNSTADLDNGYSYLSITANSLFLDWAKNWSKEQKVTICGINNLSKNCHQ